MLNVEDAPVISVPVMGESWMAEAAPTARPATPVVEEAPAPPPPPRFMSEDEDVEPVHTVAPRVMVAQGPEEPSADPEPDPELVGAAARPKFAEMEEEPKYGPMPRDYSPAGNGVKVEEPQPVGAIFTPPGQDSERDLDVPAFMRRLQF